MSEEQVVDQAPVQEPETQEPTIEERAREQGWRPLEEFDGEKAKWVSAETFVAKGELIDKIEVLGKELKNTKKAMSMLQDHHKQVKEAEFTRAVNFLKQQKKQAYEQGDVDKIIEIDEQIASVKETQKKQSEIVNTQQEDSVVHPEFSNWVDNNRWYNNDNELRDAADGIGMSHAKNNPNKSPAQVLDFVAKKIKALYPEKFTNQNRNRSSTVEGSGNSAGRRANSGSDIDMSDDEVKVMNTFVRQGIMTKEEYIKELKSVKGIQ